MFAEGPLWKRMRVGVILGKPTCIWEDGVCLDVMTIKREFVVGDKRDFFESQQKSRENGRKSDGIETL